METSNTLFGGIFGAFVVSCGAMVLLPNGQIGNLNPVIPDWDGSQPSAQNSYPTETQHIGRATYMANGCFYCHTQQVRDPQYGPDLQRGWGVRRSVARDYIFEEVPLLGSTRFGPDFSNYGSGSWRNEPVDDPKKPATRNAAWIYRHMFEPRSIVNDSQCPPQRFLFERREIGGAPSPDAAHVEGRYEWVPTAEMRNLAAYILGQNRSFAVPEAPTIIQPKEEKK
jgi:cytochrome c oxidase cbb3-type subunit II